MTAPPLDLYQKWMAKILVDHVNENKDWGRVNCRCGFGPVTAEEWSEHVMREIYRKFDP